jgi:hypothetical protein
MLLLTVVLLAQNTVAFEHMSVIPMDRERVVVDQTVITRGDRIISIGPSNSARVPAGAKRINGRGQFLIPGIADMHAHPYDTDGFPSYLAYGVTTIAVMHGSPPVLDWKRKVKTGELMGPTVYTTGPSVNGYPAGNPLFVSVETAEGARGVVREQTLAGYDFIKVYSMLNDREYRALIDEAQRLHIPVFGHIPFVVGSVGVLTSGQANVAHVEEFFNAGIQDSMFVHVAQRAARSGITVTANLFAYAHMISTIEDLQAVLHDPEMQYHSPAGLSEKLPSSNRSLRADSKGFENYLRTQQPRMRRLTKLLRDAGVPIFAGTDTETFGYPGDSNLRELDELILSGFTPYQALEAASRSPGAFMKKWLGQDEWFGVIAPGARADLVLLDANPLKDIANLRKVRGVMARGRWYTREQIQSARDSIAARNKLLHPLIVQLDSLAMKLTNGAPALRLFQDIRRDFPDATPVAELVLRGYGRQLYLKGDRPNATRLREQAAALYARSFSAENEIGRAYMYNGDTATALAHFKKALAYSPFNTQLSRMIDKLEDSTRPLRFDPIGTWAFEPFVMKIDGTPRTVTLSVAMRDSAGTRRGTVQVDTAKRAVEDLAIGGERMWIATTFGNNELNLRLTVTGDAITGVWNYGWANNGELRGRKARN